LDSVSVFTRLSRIGLEIFPITIEDEIRDFSISRVLISQHFGGTARGTFPAIKKERVQQHGFDNFMCANLVSIQHYKDHPSEILISISFPL
jgi:hypothetical protein